AAALALCIAENPGEPSAALAEYESRRLGRTTRLQEASRSRVHINHLADGPEQQNRDREFALSDPLVANGWIYAYDPESDRERRSEHPAPSR
ncbi:MAG: hypothetical protein KF680_10785, partial [Cryobacterium sp.]|nr:hypothetical protein [Cryobacterium sp.]